MLASDQVAELPCTDMCSGKDNRLFPRDDVLCRWMNREFEIVRPPPPNPSEQEQFGCCKSGDAEYPPHHGLAFTLAGLWQYHGHVTLHYAAFLGIAIAKAAEKTPEYRCDNRKGQCFGKSKQDIECRCLDHPDWRLYPMKPVHQPFGQQIVFGHRQTPTRSGGMEKLEAGAGPSLCSVSPAWTGRC